MFDFKPEYDCADVFLEKKGPTSVEDRIVFATIDARHAIKGEVLLADLGSEWSNGWEVTRVWDNPTKEFKLEYFVKTRISPK